MADNTKAIQHMPPQEVDTRSSGAEADEQRQVRTYRPLVDIVDANEEFLVIADLPGAAQDTIDITYQEDVLTIDAPVAERDFGEVQMHRQEYGVGAFHRRFVVEAPVDADQMSADYEDGVLTVHLPKAEESKGRRIEIKKA